jgi:hypothetical protein
MYFSIITTFSRLESFKTPGSFLTQSSDIISYPRPSASNLSDHHHHCLRRLSRILVDDADDGPVFPCPRTPSEAWCFLRNPSTLDIRCDSSNRLHCCPLWQLWKLLLRLMTEFSLALEPSRKGGAVCRSVAMAKPTQVRTTKPILI